MSQHNQDNPQEPLIEPQPRPLQEETPQPPSQPTQFGTNQPLTPFGVYATGGYRPFGPPRQTQPDSPDSFDGRRPLPAERDSPERKDDDDPEMISAMKMFEKLGLAGKKGAKIKVREPETYDGAKRGLKADQFMEDCMLYFKVKIPQRRNQNHLCHHLPHRNSQDLGRTYPSRHPREAEEERVEELEGIRRSLHQVIRRYGQRSSGYPRTRGFETKGTGSQLRVGLSENRDGDQLGRKYLCALLQERTHRRC